MRPLEHAAFVAEQLGRERKGVAERLPTPAGP